MVAMITIYSKVKKNDYIKLQQYIDKKDIKFHEIQSDWLHKHSGELLDIYCVSVEFKSKECFNILLKNLDAYKEQILNRMIGCAIKKYKNTKDLEYKYYIDKLHDYMVENYVRLNGFECGNAGYDSELFNKLYDNVDKSLGGCLSILQNILIMNNAQLFVKTFDDAYQAYKDNEINGQLVQEIHNNYKDFLSCPHQTDNGIYVEKINDPNYHPFRYIINGLIKNKKVDMLIYMLIKLNKYIIYEKCNNYINYSDYNYCYQPILYYVLYVQRNMKTKSLFNGIYKLYKTLPQNTLNNIKNIDKISLLFASMYYNDYKWDKDISISMCKDIASIYKLPITFENKIITLSVISNIIYEGFNRIINCDMYEDVMGGSIDLTNNEVIEWFSLNYENHKMELIYTLENYVKIAYYIASTIKRENDTFDTADFSIIIHKHIINKECTKRMRPFTTYLKGLLRILEKSKYNLPEKYKKYLTENREIIV